MPGGEGLSREIRENLPGRAFLASRALTNNHETSSSRFSVMRIHLMLRTSQSKPGAGYVRVLSADMPGVGRDAVRSPGRRYPTQS